MEISNSNVHFSLTDRPRPKRRWISFLICPLIAFVAIGYLGGGVDWALNVQLHAQTAQRIPYGSRAGMEITVTDRIGVGTSGALIIARLTKADASAYCKQYVGDTSDSCVDKYLAETHLSKSIGANCETGVFMNFYGDKLQVEKVNPGKSVRYRVTNLKDRTELDGSAASGLSYNLEQFYQLCPQWRGTATEEAQKPASRREAFPTVLARGLRAAPGAIVCSDFKTAQMLWRQFNKHWEESFQDQVTKGYSQQLRGSASTAPQVEAFGCVLLPEGSPMSLETERPFPVVSFESSGSVVRGITLPGMYTQPRASR